MTERPILFSAPMVRAILAGTKTQTRRVMSPQPSAFTPSRAHETAYFDAYCSERKTAENPRGMSDRWCWWTSDGRQGPDWIRCPYGAPGDRLWLRETWGLHSYFDETRWHRGSIADETDASPLPRWKLAYRADWGQGGEQFWRPSIHMPRWASRLTLEIASVRVERLTAISEEDARAEGVTPCWRCHGTGIDPARFEWAPDWCSECGGSAQGTTHRDEFERLWDEINGKRPGCAWRDDPWVWVIGFRRVEVA